MATVPDPLAAYEDELVARLRNVLRDGLLGVYAGGSVALADYERGQSDLDVSMVTRGALPRSAKEAVVAAVRHEALPCPARGLELVAYSQAAAATPRVGADFELNLNTGAGMAFRVDFEPGEETHWFAIDRAILAGHGIALFGPPATAVFATPPRRPLIDVLIRGLEWWKAAEATSADAVLNACRSLHFAVTGRWTSKRTAGEWAVDLELDPDLVGAALARRATGEDLDAERVRRFLATVEARLREQVAGDEAEDDRRGDEARDLLERVRDD